MKYDIPAPKINIKEFCKKNPRLVRGRKKHQIYASYKIWKKKHNHKWWTWYNGYLKSQAWFEKKEAVHKRAEYTCEICKTATSFQVHHLTYERVGNENMEDLIAVCASCHEELHNRKVAT